MRRAGVWVQKALTPEVKEQVSRRVGSSAEREGEGWPLKVGKGWVQAWTIPRVGPIIHAHVRVPKRPVFICAWNSVGTQSLRVTLRTLWPAVLLAVVPWS